MNKHYTNVESILEVKSVGVDISKDLEAPQTKSIGQLIEDDQEEKTTEKSD